MEKTYHRKFFVFAAICLIASSVALGLSFANKTAYAAVYQKVSFTSVEKDWSDDTWSVNGPVSNLIDGMADTVVRIPWGYTDGFQTENSIIASFDADKVVNKFAITLPPESDDKTIVIRHTSAWRIEVSSNKSDWSVLFNLVAANEDTEVVNGVIIPKTQDSGELEVTFSPVKCKYVKLVMLKKEGWVQSTGSFALGLVSEFAAYTDNSLSEKLRTTKAAYSAVAQEGKVFGGEVANLYDGDKVWVNNTVAVPTLYMWENSYIEFTLQDAAALSAIRVYPYGYEVEKTDSGAIYKMGDNSAIDATYVRSGAYENLYFPKGLKIYGKVAKADNYTLIGTFTSIPNDVYAQDFFINEASRMTDYKYYKLAITEHRGTSEYPLSAFTEIELLATVKTTAKLEAVKTSVTCRQGKDPKIDLIYTDEEGNVSQITNSSAGVTVTGFDKSVLGEQHAVVSYAGLSVTVNITVVEAGSAITVKFNTNGGSAVGDIQATYGELCEKPQNPTKSGFRFLCWCIDETLETEFSFNFPVESEESEIALYAKWRAESDDPTPSGDTEESGCFAGINGVGLGMVILPVCLAAVVIKLIAKRKTNGDK